MSRLVRCWRRAVVARGFATATFAKTGRPTQVVALGPDTDIKLGDNEVAIKMLAASVSPLDLGIIQGTVAGTPSLPAVPGGEGVGVVTAVGPRVSGLEVDDWVIPAVPAFGTWRTTAKAQAEDLVKVPNDIPVEYAASMHTALTAVRLLEDFGDLKEGDFIVQYHAQSPVGLAIVQIAKTRGIGTINLIPEERPGYLNTAKVIKNLGADMVARDQYVYTEAYKRIMAELPKPKLAISGGGDATKLAPLVEGGNVVSYRGSSDVPPKGNKEEFSVAKWLSNASPSERSSAVNAVVELFRSGALNLYVERHPFSDLHYALREAEDPIKNRRVVLIMQEEEPAAEVPLSPEDLRKLERDFEAAVAKLRA